jgi:transcriptional regulator with XRE-family HTH domain
MSKAQRIQEIIDYYGMSYNSFAISLGMLNGTSIKRIVDDNRNPQNQTLQKILNAYPEVNQEWLITGKGEIIKGEKSLSNEEDLTVTAKQIIDRLEFDKSYYDNKLKEDRKHYASERQEMNDESIAKLLKGFQELEKKVEHYAVSASTKVVETLIKGMAEQNKMLLEGFKKIQLVESDLEDIKTFMAAKFELQKMNKKKAKQIKKLTPR